MQFTCPHCGAQTEASDQYAGMSGPCKSCGKTITLPRLPGGPVQRIEDDPGLRMLLPVGRSPWAIAAGYAGLFAIVMFPAPIALLLGIVAIRDIKKHPDRHGMGRAVFGLVMGILFSFFLLMTIIAMASAP